MYHAAFRLHVKLLKLCDRDTAAVENGRTDVGGGERSFERVFAASVAGADDAAALDAANTSVTLTLATSIKSGQFFRIVVFAGGPIIDSAGNRFDGNATA